MKIGFILPNYGMGISGGLKVIYEYANFLADRGHEVVLYDYVNRTLEYLPKFIPIPLKKTYGHIKAKIEPRWFKLNKGIRKKAIFSIEEVEDGDVIVATAIRTAVPTSTLEKAKGKKFYFIQGFENWDYTDNQVFDTYKLGMNNIVVAKWLKEIVDSHADGSSFLVSNGVDTNVFKVTNPIESRPLHSIAFHYRSTSIKGCKYALEAVKCLKKKYPDLITLIVSMEDKPKDLPDFCKYYKQASAKTVAEINNQVSVFICSSIEEGFGLPGLEAMACGCALVTSRFQGALEYADETNSVLVPAKNAGALVEGVSRIFEDHKLRCEVCRHGMETAAKMSVIESASLFEDIIIRKG